MHKIYSCNDAGDDLMLIGNVTWTFNDGSSDNGAFAARALIEEGDSKKPRLKLYQGWAVRIMDAVTLDLLTAASRISQISWRVWLDKGKIQQG